MEEREQTVIKSYIVNNIGDKGAGALSEALINNHSLAYLSLRCDDGIERLNKGD